VYNPRKLYGNCIVCALLLKMVYGGKIRRITTHDGGPKHWIVKLPNGELWHFKKKSYFPWYVLPGFMKYLLFSGSFEKLGNR
jgi:hypothetical protein